MSYQMDMATPEEMATTDPFMGAGVFLPLEAATEAILEALESRFETAVQAIVWPMRGAWADTAAAGMTPGEMLARWERS